LTVYQRARKNYVRTYYICPLNNKHIRD
jgi:hypothetical protein